MATDSGEVEASLIGPMNGGGVVREMRTGTGWDAVERYERGAQWMRGHDPNVDDIFSSRDKFCYASKYNIYLDAQ